jgi:exonuclease III
LKNREHFVQVKQLILDNQYKIIAVSESWLNSNVSNAEVQIEGYNLIRHDRLRKSGGGVCAYIHTSLKAHAIRELTATSDTGFQQLWIKVQNRKLRSILICVTYKPPSCPTVCLEQYFVPTYTKALCYNKDIVICGDLNCNLINNESPDTQALVTFCITMNLTQLIAEPTRVTASSQSLIDVILVSNPGIVMESGVVMSTISDHYVCYYG